MDDLISRQAAIDILEVAINDDWEFDYAKDRMIELSVQPEIIRCKDCKYYETMYCKMDVWTDDMRIYKAKPNDFCSYAERKKDG